MAKTFLTGIDLKQNELLNARVHNVINDPSTGVPGQIIFNQTDNKFAVFNGTIWERMGSGSGEGHSYALSGSGVTLNLYEDGSTAAGSYTIPSATSSNPGVMTATQAAKLAGIAEGATANTGTVTQVSTSGAITGGPITTTGTISHSTSAGYKHIPSSGSANQYLKYGGSSGTAAWQSPDTEPTSGSSNLITSDAVYDAISGLGTPMQFKGTLGTGGTITSLPTAAASNAGFSYKVITAGTYASQAAKVGDMFVSDGSAWILIPSGDEPAGTVTNIATGTGLTGGPISSSGTISHLATNGYKHIPQNGAANQYLKYSGTAGTAAWQSPDTTPTSSSSNLITSGAVKTALDSIVHPEQISRATFTIASGSSTGSVNIGSGKTVFAVTAIQSNAGVVADWSYSGSSVTVTLATNATAAVAINVLYYGGGSVSSEPMMMDYVVEQGTDSYWTYRKWSSGVSECWGTFPTTFPLGTRNARYGSFPDIFVSGENPVLNANVKLPNTTNAQVNYTETSPSGWTTYIYGDGSGTVDCWIFLQARGRWK